MALKTFFFFAILAIVLSVSFSAPINKAASSLIKADFGAFEDAVSVRDAAVLATTERQKKCRRVCKRERKRVPRRRMRCVQRKDGKCVRRKTVIVIIIIIVRKCRRVCS